MTKYLLVLLGGGLGAVLRFAAGTLVSKFFAGIFPLATFLINITGSFAIGVLMTLFVNHWSTGANWRLFLVTGILGGYTTFSSFEWEAFAGLRGGAGLVAIVYLLLSVLVGLAGVWVGATLAGGARGR